MRVAGGGGAPSCLQYLGTGKRADIPQALITRGCVTTFVYPYTLQLLSPHNGLYSFTTSSFH